MKCIGILLLLVVLVVFVEAQRGRPVKAAKAKGGQPCNPDADATDAEIRQYQRDYPEASFFPDLSRLQETPGAPRDSIDTPLPDSPDEGIPVEPIDGVISPILPPDWEDREREKYPIPIPIPVYQWYPPECQETCRWTALKTSYNNGIGYLVDEQNIKWKPIRAQYFRECRCREPEKPCARCVAVTGQLSDIHKCKQEYTYHAVLVKPWGSCGPVSIRFFKLNSGCCCRCDPELIVKCPKDIISDKPAGCDKVQIFWKPPSFAQAYTTCIKSEITSVTSSHQPGSYFTAGIHTVTYTFTNSAGMMKNCSFNIIVPVMSTADDKLPPTISNCPANINDDVALPGQTQKNIFWTPPTAEDDSLLPVTVTPSHTPGSLFETSGISAPNGYTLVTYTVVDQAGNVAVCKFAVKLNSFGATPDTTPPSISGCPPYSTSLWSSLNKIQVVSPSPYTIPSLSATDNVALAPSGPITTHSAGSQIFPVGKTKVEWTHYDTSGNSATCTYYIFVRSASVGSDTTKPTVANCPPNVYREIPAGTTTRVCWKEPSATDNSGDSAILHAQTRQSGAEFAINVCGSDSITSYVWHDTSGNRIICAFSVTVRAINHASLPGTWTSWNNYDFPSLYCDCEIPPTTSPFPCGSSTPGVGIEPIDIECQTSGGLDWRDSSILTQGGTALNGGGQVAWCCPKDGFVCFNSWNELVYPANSPKCLNYKVRFKCPL